MLILMVVVKLMIYEQEVLPANSSDRGDVKSELSVPGSPHQRKVNKGKERKDSLQSDGTDIPQ